MFLQYLIELMFLELDVSGCIGLISSFDRSGTTVFNYSSLRASLLTVLYMPLFSLFLYSKRLANLL